MIKPETLWNLFKSSEDPMWLGQVCIALGKRDPKGLDPAQRVMFDMIERDSQWHDERCEKKKEQNAARQRAARERKEKEKEAASRTVTQPCVTHACHTTLRDEQDVTAPCVTNKCHDKPSNPSKPTKPSFHHSIDKSIEEDGIRNERDANEPEAPPPPSPPPSPSSFRIPKWKQVMAYINHEDCKLDPGFKITEAEARDWFRYRTAGDWRKDNGSAITNWRTDLLSNSARMRKRNGDASPTATAQAEETTDALNEAAEQILKQRQMRNRT